MSHLNEGAKEEKQEKGVRHYAMIWSIGWEGSVLGENGREWSKLRGCEGG